MYDPPLRTNDWLGKYPVAVDELGTKEADVQPDLSSTTNLAGSSDRILPISPELDEPSTDAMIAELVDEPPAEHHSISTAKMVKPHDFSDGPIEV